MGLSDMIARFIQEILEEEDGCCELQRAQLASRFNCVPSQINYVISTRFSPQQGYIVESRRGGGGYIRIRQACLSPYQVVLHAVTAVGEDIDAHTAMLFIRNLQVRGAIHEGSAGLMLAAVSDNALRCLSQPQRDRTRAAILKQMLAQSMCKGDETT